MTCEFKLKGYCFHPDNAKDNFIAIECKDNCQIELMQSDDVKRQFQESEAPV